MCCCTDAVVAHDLGNDAEDVLQAFSSLANRRTKGKTVQKICPESELWLHHRLHLGKSDSAFSFPPNSFLKPVSFACIKKKER